MSRVLTPRSLAELWEAMADHPQAALYAGGTDLLPAIRRGAPAPETLICLERIEEIKGVERREGRLRLGAGTVHADLLEHALVREELPVLAQALSVLGSPPIRRMGTLGGNLVTASPAGDCLPPLYVLEARVETASAQGRRLTPIRDFILGPGRTALAPGEIVAAVEIERPPVGALHHFEKAGKRRALAIAVASLAALLELGEDGEIRRARLAWGSLGPTVVASRLAAEALEGRPLNLESLRAAADLARREVRPISDPRASREYRRALAGNLILRLAEISA
jgi:CO/xanthine dehydrogenase FAD-binding subunit